MMKIGYIKRNNLELNPHLNEKFKFLETTFTRKITSRSDRVYSKLFMPLEYEEIVENANIMKNFLTVQKDLQNSPKTAKNFFIYFSFLSI